jgi:hypothetical protein
MTALSIKAEILSRINGAFLRKPVYSDKNTRLAVLSMLYNKRFGLPKSVIVWAGNDTYVRCYADGQGGYTKELASLTDPDVQAIRAYLAEDWQTLFSLKP